MRWKILIKLLYLIILFVVAACEWDRESQLIDSDLQIDTTTIQLPFSRLTTKLEPSFSFHPPAVIFVEQNSDYNSQIFTQ